MLGSTWSRVMRSGPKPAAPAAPKAVAGTKKATALAKRGVPDVSAVADPQTATFARGAEVLLHESWIDGVEEHDPDAADLVATDPVQAGVMAVMGIADTAKFDFARQKGRRY